MYTNSWALERGKRYRQIERNAKETILSASHCDTPSNTELFPLCLFLSTYERDRSFTEEQVLLDVGSASLIRDAIF